MQHPLKIYTKDVFSRHIFFEAKHQTSAQPWLPTVSLICFSMSRCLASRMVLSRSISSLMLLSNVAFTLEATKAFNCLAHAASWESRFSWTRVIPFQVESCFDPTKPGLSPARTLTSWICELSNLTIWPISPEVSPFADESCSKASFNTYKFADSAVIFQAPDNYSQQNCQGFPQLLVRHRPSLLECLETSSSCSSPWIRWLLSHAC
jgi:hypothetical protein